MNKNHLNKLKKIKDKLAHMQNDIDEIISEVEQEESVTKTVKYDFNIETVLESLKNSSREQASSILENLKQKEVSVVFTSLGGPTRDQKKKKDWLIERILWQLFDFKEGHNLLRN